jgi:hypothetical protein
MNHLPESENLAYHSMRLLIIISICGKPQKSNKGILPGIEGRTLLAKLDFFLRYPSYLQKAAKILGKELTDAELGLITKEELNSVESHMVRYKYGPWDHIYYTTLAYLIGKQLINVEQEVPTEIFRVTQNGRNLVGNLETNPAYSDLIARAKSIYKLFNTYGGTTIKNFIYNNFPEVVNRKLGEVII